MAFIALDAASLLGRPLVVFHKGVLGTPLGASAAADADSEAAPIPRGGVFVIFELLFCTFCWTAYFCVPLSLAQFPESVVLGRFAGPLFVRGFSVTFFMEEGNCLGAVGYVGQRGRFAWESGGVKVGRRVPRGVANWVRLRWGRQSTQY